MTGRTFHRLIIRATNNPFAGGSLGVIGGALTQSTNAMTFIVISLVTSGMIELKKGLPVIIWANLGTSALVLMATLDIHLFILFLLGLTGMGFYFDLDRSGRYGKLLGALLGLGLLFYGLFLIKSGAAPIKDFAWVNTVMGLASGSTFIAFIVGMLLTVILQSSATVTVIAVTLLSVGLFSLEQTIMIVFGASLGSGLSALLLSMNLAGTGKQLALFQVFLKILGLIIVMPVFLLGEQNLISTVSTLQTAYNLSPGTKVALIYLTLQLVSSISMTALSGPMLHVVKRISPQTDEERLSEPRFLYTQALEEAQSALDLVEREQSRLVNRLPVLLAEIRDKDETALKGNATDTRKLYLTSSTLSASCAEYLSELIEGTRDHDALERIVKLQNCNNLIINLQDSCMELIDCLHQTIAKEKAMRLHAQLAEGLHVLLATLAETVESRDPDDLSMLIAMSGNRTGLMERIRSDYLKGETSLATTDKQQILTATSLIERIAWLIQRYTDLLLVKG